MKKILFAMIMLFASSVFAQEDSKRIHQSEILAPTEHWVFLKKETHEVKKMTFFLVFLHNPAFTAADQVSGKIFLVAPTKTPDHMLLLIATFYNKNSVVSFERHIDVVGKTKKMTECFDRKEVPNQ